MLKTNKPIRNKFSNTYQNLESRLFKNPTNLDAWAVYGDLLQVQNDPRGEAIALELDLYREVRIHAPYIRKQVLIKEHEPEWLGPQLSKLKQNGFLKLIWRFGYLWSVVVNPTRGAGAKLNHALDLLLKSSSCRFLNSLYVFGEQAPQRSSGVDINHLQPLFQNARLAKLSTLKLFNFEFDDSLIPQLFTAPLLKGLKSLTLSHLRLSNKGAQLLVNNFSRLDFLKNIYLDDSNVDTHLSNMLTELYGERIKKVE